VGNGNVSADLTASMLSPASSVFPDGEQSSHPESDRKARRRARQERESATETESQPVDSLALDAADPSPHQLDHLA
jgi:hypothetical protein